MLRTCALSVGLALAVAPVAFADPARPAPLPIPKELLKQRLEAARMVWQVKVAIRNRHPEIPASAPSAEWCAWSERWLEAELALADKQDQRVQALQCHLERVRFVERSLVNRFKAARGTQGDVAAATYYRVEAEIRLLKEGVQPPPLPKEDDGLPKPMPLPREKKPELKEGIPPEDEPGPKKTNEEKSGKR